MRICLFLSSAIALVALATTFPSTAAGTAVASYAYPNDEHDITGFFTLVDRLIMADGTRRCTILDRGETQAFRNLYPVDRRGERAQVISRKSHNEDHHHGPSFADQENGEDASRDLLELNTNAQKDWAEIEQGFLKSVCDHQTEDGSADALVDLTNFSRLPQAQGQQVFKGSANGLQEDDEVRKLIDSGPDKNRVTIVFMGDGYTLDERDRFFSDMQRLVDDMFVGDTFKSFLPLFNVYALFRPSRESGIGVNGKWKDTSFRLYRDGTELRGIYVADPRAARQACRAVGKYACDFPSLIGNDPYYGGLGGEFVISTSSNKSGTVVLRHELGHSLINVGEEYDGGYVYSGVNAERWSIQNIKWKHWLTDAIPREEKNVLRAQDYAWYDLKKGPYKVKFNSDGQWKRWSLKISHSGVDTDDSFEVYLDGKRLNWTTPGGYDRDFSEWAGEEGFNPSRPIRQLCSVTMHEFMGEDLYRFDNSVISAYPTYDINGRKTWRSNHEHCLMRNMASTQFCSVCKEGLWHRLLGKASLLDGINVDCQRDDDEKEISSFAIEAKVIPLGQFRDNLSQRIDGEAYTARWLKNGEHQPEFDDEFRIEVPGSEEGIWEIKIDFKTPEARKDPRGLLKASKVFVVAKRLCTQ
ncbi:hypothetical protein BGZ54_007026 [Gamsiella multidivaricata]|nr:hypothetical protein BGZ54_007026 [Gamsiella multidivaricata]